MSKFYMAAVPAVAFMAVVAMAAVAYLAVNNVQFATHW